MNHLTTTDLSRIFGERIGQEIVLKEDKSLSEIEVIERVDTLNNRLNGLSFSSYYLLLTPLEKISDEDLTDMAIVFQVQPHLVEFTLMEIKEFTLGKNLYISDDEDSPLFGFTLSLQMFIGIIKILTNKGYDVPMFFGLNHPDNGKTLIELGVAIDKETLK